MESSDIEKIEKIFRDMKDGHKFLSGRSKTYDAFVQFLKEAFTGGTLDKKTRELIGVGISIVIHCEPCLVWHMGESIRAGASDQEILESMEVAMEMGGGPATITARFGLKVLEFFRARQKGQKHAVPA